jgi:hypothetical protein
MPACKHVLDSFAEKLWTNGNHTYKNSAVRTLLQSLAFIWCTMHTEINQHTLTYIVIVWLFVYVQYVFWFLRRNPLSHTFLCLCSLIVALYIHICHLHIVQTYWPNTNDGVESSGVWVYQMLRNRACKCWGLGNAPLDWWFTSIAFMPKWSRPSDDEESWHSHRIDSSKSEIDESSTNRRNWRLRRIHAVLFCVKKLCTAEGTDKKPDLILL